VGPSRAVWGGSTGGTFGMGRAVAGRERLCGCLLGFYWDLGASMRLKKVGVSTRVPGDSCVIKWRMKASFRAPVARPNEATFESSEGRFRSIDPGHVRVLRSGVDVGDGGPPDWFGKMPCDEVWDVDVCVDGCSPENLKGSVRKKWQLPSSSNITKIREWLSRMRK
jgi:hypothetical protein